MPDYTRRYSNRQTRRPTPQRSEFSMIIEFIGVRTLVGIGAAGALYFYSGYYNFLNGMSFFRAFSPYYALRIHDGNRVASSLMDSMGDGMDWLGGQIGHLFDYLSAQTTLFIQNEINPFVQENPVLGFSMIATIGFLLTILLFYTFIIIGQKIFHTVVRNGPLVPISRAQTPQTYSWDFDPSRKPSDDQLAGMTRQLERSVQRVPAMNGLVPKNADITIRELAGRYRNHDSKFRCAVYVMGPIKGTSYTNNYELPLTLEQIKKISGKMGNAATYETLPLDLVVLECPKNAKDWKLYREIPPIRLGTSYPVKVVEKVMLNNRAWFIWDSRVKKSVVGYGLHGVNNNS